MNKILADFIANLNSENETKSIDTNSCDYLDISYEEYKKLNPKLNNVLYICKDATNIDEEQSGVIGTGGIVTSKGKVFKGSDECTPKDNKESLIEIALRNGYSGNQYSIPTPSVKPMFESYIIVDNLFTDIESPNSNYLYIKLSPMECRIYRDNEWIILFKKIIDKEDLSVDIISTLNNISLVLDNIKTLAYKDKVSTNELDDDILTIFDNTTQVLTEYELLILANKTSIDNIMVKLNEIKTLAYKDKISLTDIDEDFKEKLKISIANETMAGIVKGGEDIIITDSDGTLGLKESNVITKIIRVSDWIDNKAVIEIDGISLHSTGTASLPLNTSSDIYDMCAKANIVISSQNNNNIIFSCYGATPNKDINIRIEYRSNKNGILGSIKSMLPYSNSSAIIDESKFATAEQGRKADTSLQTTGGAISGDITINQYDTGLYWHGNTDSASVRFTKNEGTEQQSNLEFNITDDQDDSFLWSCYLVGNPNKVELMKLNAMNGLNINTIAKINGKNIIDESTYRNVGVVHFGGNEEKITTSQFIDRLKEYKAFDNAYWVGRGTWSYFQNQIISDVYINGFQKSIHLSGTVVEVFCPRWDDRQDYTIRLTTPSTGQNGVYSQFIYINNGPEYSPGWYMMWTDKNGGHTSGMDADTVDGMHGYQMQTLGESGNMNGTDWVLHCQHNLDGDGYMKLRCGNGYLQTKVDNTNQLGGKPARDYIYAPSTSRPFRLDELNNSAYPMSYRTSTSESTKIGLPFTWSHIDYYRHIDNNGYGAQMAIKLDGGIPALLYRNSSGGVWSNWYRVDAVKIQSDAPAYGNELWCY